MPSSRVLLIIPPLTQLNTPYPSTAYLTGFLRSRGYSVSQADLGLEMVLSLFSRSGLTEAFARIRRQRTDLSGEAVQLLALQDAYLDTIDAVIGFLQGRDPGLAPRICQGGFLPQGPRFTASAVHDAHPQRVATTELAKHLATLYLEDLTDLLRRTIAPHFALSRYAETLGRSAGSYTPVEEALHEAPSLPDEILSEALRRHMDVVRPTVVGLTVPFPGNLYGALRIAQAVKRRDPAVRVVLGGGYANTELRRLSDPRIFDVIDYLTLDDGECPLLCLLEHLDGTRDARDLCRTYCRAGDRVLWHNGARESHVAMADLGTPTYDGLPLSRYVSVLDTLNPMHRLWSDGHWNKLTVAHGCYWKQCTFCDVGLDYIGRYEAAPAEILTDRVEALVTETGRRGFHFVDEAAPPAGLKALALCLLERGVPISWWGNIRFEEAFTPDLCRLLAASGCIAVTAGLEAASDRLLTAMKKGVTVAQAARVASAFRSAGVMVHAYLMYGLPGETVGETIETLERVRHMFARDLLQSAFWHKFAATAHSPVGLAPEAHGIRIVGPAFAGFAENDLAHEDSAARLPSWLGDGLRAAVMNFMEGRGLSLDVQRWFPRRVPKPRVPRDWITRALSQRVVPDEPTAERRLVWMGGVPVVEPSGRGFARVVLPNRQEDRVVRLPLNQAGWLTSVIREATPDRQKHGAGYPLLRDIRERYPFGGPGRFDRFWRSATWGTVRAAGLLTV